MKEYESILRLFKGIAYREGDNIKDVPSEKALKYGVYISSGFPNEVIDEAIKQYGRNGEEANQTFHKSLFKVATEDLTKLYIEQAIHYFTTYGFEELGIYNEESVYIPKEKLDIPELQVDTISFIVIKPITIEAIKELIKNMITSNLALSKQTVQDIVNLSDYIDINEYSDGDNYFSKIKNKEVKSALYGKLGILPKRGDEFLRYLLAKLCDKTLLIKDRETIARLGYVDNKELYKLLDRYKKQYGLIPLAKVFNRFKPLFIAMKRHPQQMIRDYYKKDDIVIMKNINQIINAISKLSKKYHQPMPESDFGNFIKWCENNDKNRAFKDILEHKISEVGIYTAIKLYNYLSYDIQSSISKVYKIRNGKVFVKGAKNNKYLRMLYSIIKDEIQDSVKNKTIYIPYGIDYKMPQSEKQYVGNLPFGTTIELEKKALIFGIHWVNISHNINSKVDPKFTESLGIFSQDRVDLDLHLNSPKYNIGWHEECREHDMLLFTGDNTTAPLPNGASEFIYVSPEIEDTTFSFKINNYTTTVGPIPYEIIVGVADPDKIKSEGRNFIIDPNDIIVKIPMEMELGKSEQIVGIIDVTGDKIKLIFTDLSTSNLAISTDDIIANSVRNYIKNSASTQLSVEKLLEDCGAKLTTERTTEIKRYYFKDEYGNERLIDEDELDNLGLSGDELSIKITREPVDIDLSLEALTKDSFIKLLGNSEG